MTTTSLKESTYTRFIFIAACVMLFSACNKPKEQDITGAWIVLSAKYKHQELMLHGFIASVETVPVGFRGKSILRFEPDGSIIFPGMNSHAVPCSSRITNDTLIITLDSLRVRNETIGQFDGLRVQSMLKHDSKLMDVYKANCDSALLGENVVAIEKAALVYTGVYKMKMDRSLLTITSPTTEFYMLNQDDALYGRVNQMFITGN